MTALRPGSRNLITDVAGLTVGNVHDERLRSGVTALVCTNPAVAGVQVLGGAPGTRETDLLEAHNAVEAVDAIVLLPAAPPSVLMPHRAFRPGCGKTVAASSPGSPHPHRPCRNLVRPDERRRQGLGRYPRPIAKWDTLRLPPPGRFRDRSSGAGYGALSAGLKGGLGSASTILPSGVTVGALVPPTPPAPSPSDRAAISGPRLSR